MTPEGLPSLKIRPSVGLPEIRGSFTASGFSEVHAGSKIAILNTSVDIAARADTEKSIALKRNQNHVKESREIRRLHKHPGDLAPWENE